MAETSHADVLPSDIQGQDIYDGIQRDAVNIKKCLKSSGKKRKNSWLVHALNMKIIILT